MSITIIEADYNNPAHGDAIVALLRAYAMDPMGGGEDLSQYAQDNVVAGLAAHHGAFTFLAYDGETPVGIADCMTEFSTFKAKKDVNIHDVAVLESARGKGVGKALFAAIEERARALDAGKITLEVLHHNHGAKGLYASLGYGDTPQGAYHFWTKEL